MRAPRREGMWVAEGPTKDVKRIPLPPKSCPEPWVNTDTATSIVPTFCSWSLTLKKNTLPAFLSSSAMSVPRQYLYQAMQAQSEGLQGWCFAALVLAEGPETAFCEHGVRQVKLLELLSLSLALSLSLYLSCYSLFSLISSPRTSERGKISATFLSFPVPLRSTRVGWHVPSSVCTHATPLSFVKIPSRATLQKASAIGSPSNVKALAATSFQERLAEDMWWSQDKKHNGFDWSRTLSCRIFSSCRPKCYRAAPQLDKV